MEHPLGQPLGHPLGLETTLIHVGSLFGVLTRESGIIKYHIVIAEEFMELQRQGNTLSPSHPSSSMDQNPDGVGLPQHPYAVAAHIPSHGGELLLTITAQNPCRHLV